MDSGAVGWFVAVAVWFKGDLYASFSLNSDYKIILFGLISTAIRSHNERFNRYQFKPRFPPAVTLSGADN